MTTTIIATVLILVMIVTLYMLHCITKEDRQDEDTFDKMGKF